MSSFTISLPEDHISKLKKIAIDFGVTPEELVRVSIEEMLNKPEEIFQETMKYVLSKNKELYRRLS